MKHKSLSISVISDLKANKYHLVLILYYLSSYYLISYLVNMRMLPTPSLK